MKLPEDAKTSVTSTADTLPEVRIAEMPIARVAETLTMLVANPPWPSKLIIPPLDPRTRYTEKNSEQIFALLNEFLLFLRGGGTGEQRDIDIIGVELAWRKQCHAEERKHYEEIESAEEKIGTALGLLEKAVTLELGKFVEKYGALEVSHMLQTMQKVRARFGRLLAIILRPSVFDRSQSVTSTRTHDNLKLLQLEELFGIDIEVKDDEGNINIIYRQYSPAMELAHYRAKLVHEGSVLLTLRMHDTAAAIFYLSSFLEKIGRRDYTPLAGYRPSQPSQ